MSGWTEFVIAKVTDAHEIADEASPKERWPGVEGYKFFGPELLAPLCEILSNEPATWEDFPELAFGESGCVYELPPTFVSSLGMLKEEKLPGVAEAWSSHLAKNNQRYTSEQLQSLLGEIRGLAIRARKSRKPVLLWQSSSG